MSSQNKFFRIPITAVPNFVFDYWQSNLSPFEFSVLLCICRKTYGWQKDTDKISISQMEKATGISRTTIKECLKNLEEYDLVEIVRKKTTYGDSEINEYSVKYHDVDEEIEKKFGRAANDQGVGRETTEGVGRQTTPQKKDITKETIQQPEPDHPWVEKSQKLAPSAVVVSSLHKLNIPDSLKFRISMDNSEDKINISVERVLKWEGRESDAAAIQIVLKRFDEWEDKTTHEQMETENQKFLNTLRHLDGLKIAESWVVVGNTYFEIACPMGNNGKFYDITSKKFKEDVEKELEWIKERERKQQQK